MNNNRRVKIVGGGLAGCEAAWQVAERGVNVELYEMRPEKSTAVHCTEKLAEMVCSNSFGSKLPDRPRGALLEEMRILGSLTAEIAEKSAVPAGGALAVDRDGFAKLMTDCIEKHPLIEVVREEIKTIPEDGPVILASGPLTSPALSESIRAFTGSEFVSFYDAMAPIVAADSIDMSKAFRQSRYDRGDLEEGDYVNCPMNREQYYNFAESLRSAERIKLHDFENEDKNYFEACLPLEVLVERNPESLLFGPLTPKGLTNPHSPEKPCAVLQLRQDDFAGTLYNIVGAQTNLKWTEQKRVFRSVPGLESAEFIRYGQMHRNTFITAPEVLQATLQCREREDLFMAGQLAGVEGYICNSASGLLAGVNAARLVNGEAPLTLPAETMLGALAAYLAHAESKHFQPMKVNFGLLPPLENRPRKKRERKQAYAQRAISAMKDYVSSLPLHV